MSPVWKRALIVAPVFLVAAVAAGFKWVEVHNTLATQRAAVAEQWTQVESALNARAALMPEVVEIVRKFAGNDESLVHNLEGSGAALAAAHTPLEKMRANDRLSNALGRVLVAAESNPKLRSDSGFSTLQDEIADSENRIAIERRKYNEILEHYNAQIQIFPDNVVASVSGFRRNDDYFKTDGANTTGPKVQF